MQFWPSMRMNDIHQDEVGREMLLGLIEMLTLNPEYEERFRKINAMGFTDGIENYIPAGNQIDQAGVALDMETLESWFSDFFLFGSSEKMGFGGNTTMLTIQQVIRKNTTYRIITGEKEFGMNVTRLITPFGELVLKTHPLFNQLTGGTTGSADYFGANSWLFVLDMQELQFVHLKGGDAQFQQKLQANGLDSVKSGYLSEVALELHHPTAHHLRKGLSGAAADPTD